MREESMRIIEVALDTLRRCLIGEGVSIAFDKENESLCFFDTKHYLETKKLNGFKVKLEDLVK